MTTGITIRKRPITAAALLTVLGVLVAVLVLLTPQREEQDSAGSSSYSAGASGLRIMYELSQAMGWQPSRRTAPLDSAKSPSVQVVIDPQGTLGAVEVHRLLENVRRGGGLIFAIDDEEIGDSLGVFAGREKSYLRPLLFDTLCLSPQAARERVPFSLLSVPRAIRWKRPPPGPLTPIRIPSLSEPTMDVGTSFPLGAGRVAILGSSVLAANFAVRTCSWGADIAVARALESVRPVAVPHPRLVFDEYHHGYGAHGGSMEAVSLYLAHTSSGRFLAQVLVAAFALLLATAPRTLAPREPARIARRSPIEHADALAHAYTDVRATRTAASRLVSGLRRRTGRLVSVSPSADDTVFLDAVVERSPALAASSTIVRRALSETLDSDDFVTFGTAIRDIEAGLATSPPTRS